MLFCSPTSQKINFQIIALAVVLLHSVVGCISSDGGTTINGGITIGQNDNTAPTLTLGAGHKGTAPAGQNVNVSAGGSDQKMTLTSKTGFINLIASANDPESGVQALEIWMNKKVSTCDANGTCGLQHPGLQSAPQFEYTSPRKQPGEKTPDSRTMLQAVDLSKEIPQGSPPPGGSRTVTLIFVAKAVNHLGQTVSTPSIEATWSEP